MIFVCCYLAFLIVLFCAMFYYIKQIHENPKHEHIKFMFYDIKGLITQLDKLFENGYVCLSFDKNSFKSRFEFSENLELLKSNDVSNLRFSKKLLENYVLKNLINENNIQEYKQEVVLECFKDENIKNIWWINDYEDFVRVVNLQSLIVKLIESEVPFKLEKNRNYFNEWFSTFKKKDVVIKCNIGRMFKESDIINIDMLKCGLTLGTPITTVFDKVEAAILAIPYFNYQNSYEYVVAPGLYKIYGIENGVQNISKCLITSQKGIDLSNGVFTNHNNLSQQHLGFIEPSLMSINNNKQSEAVKQTNNNNLNKQSNDAKQTNNSNNNTELTFEDKFINICNSIINKHMNKHNSDMLNNFIKTVENSK